MPKKTFKKDWSTINQKIKDRKKKFKNDERIYVPTFNENNQAKVTMRFLDSPDIDMPYAEVKSHFFNDVGGWFIENCPSTIGKDCPVCADLYANNYYETDNDLYYERKKATSYFTNVLIIDDQNKPDNNGKVFIFKFGSKIMEKVDDILEEGKQPWDDNCGVNFVFSAKKKGGKMTNYDASRFSDEETELASYGKEKEILDQRHKLGELLAESAFKSHEDLKKKYEKVTGEDNAPAKSSRSKKPTSRDEDDDEDEGIIEDDIDDDIGDEDMLSEGEDDDFFDDLDDEE
jgi:hypothetical protein